jgi:hypothetical protein
MAMASSAPLTGCRLISRITSPGLRAARDAGVPGMTDTMRAPERIWEGMSCSHRARASMSSTLTPASGSLSDEAGFEGDPRPRAKWVKRGSPPTQGYYGGHIRQNVVGAVNPRSGQLVSLIVPHCDTEVFQAFLDTMAEEVPAVEGRRVILVLDNASWHKTKRLAWHHITAVYLPAYSPDFNPIERLWQHLKSHYLAGYLTKSGQQLANKIYDSIRDLLGRPETIQSVCRTHSG